MRLRIFAIVMLAAGLAGIGYIALINMRSNPPFAGNNSGYPTLVSNTPAASVLPALQSVRPYQLTQVTRAIRADFPDMAASRSQIAALEKNIRGAGFNLVSLGAGRAEWTYFKWIDHAQDWSDEVKASGIDYLAQDTARFGAWAYVNAEVDVLSPLYIQKNPQAAAVSYDGVPSTTLVSTMELAEGAYGKALLEMITAIAANYPVTSISINELYYRRDGFGTDDRAAYLKATGRTDWPRAADGSIAYTDASIVAWRSAEIQKFIGQAARIVHSYGKYLFVNAAINLQNGGNPILDDGLSLESYGGSVDKIILWGFFDLETISPQTLQQAAQTLVHNGYGQSIFVFGLWNKENLAVATAKLAQGAAAVEAGGLKNIWITPASLMDATHWQAARSIWDGQ